MSSLTLIGVGTSGTRIARGVVRAFGEHIRYLTADTDAASRQDDDNFVLLGGDRLSGRGTGGDVVSARLAAEDSVANLDPALEGVRLAVVVTSLGGGTGGGATLEVLKRLAAHGIPSIVFATLPFSFEGETRQRNARGVMAMIEENANSVLYMPLDKLVGEVDNMDEALRRATDTIANGVTLFWRLLEKPGYVRLDAERIRHLLTGAGRGRFATVSVQGAERANEAVNRLVSSEMLAMASAPIKSIVCGVLGGEDLRLSELATISDGLRQALGNNVAFDIGTVNDEMTFCGRISVVVMIFESSTGSSNETTGTQSAVRKNKRLRNSPVAPITSRGGRFNNAEPTNRGGEDLDIPTFIRRNINLEF